MVMHVYQCEYLLQPVDLCIKCECACVNIVDPVCNYVCILPPWFPLGRCGRLSQRGRPAGSAGLPPGYAPQSPQSGAGAPSVCTAATGAPWTGGIAGHKTGGDYSWTQDRG